MRAPICRVFFQWHERDFLAKESELRYSSHVQYTDPAGLEASYLSFEAHMILHQFLAHGTSSHESCRAMGGLRAWLCGVGQACPVLSSTSIVSLGAYNSSTIQLLRSLYSVYTARDRFLRPCERSCRSSRGHRVISFQPFTFAEILQNIRMTPAFGFTPT